MLQLPVKERIVVALASVRVASVNEMSGILSFPSAAFFPQKGFLSFQQWLTGVSWVLTQIVAPVSISDIIDIVLQGFDKFVNLMNGQLSFKTYTKGHVSCSMEDEKF